MLKDTDRIGHIHEPFNFFRWLFGAKKKNKELIGGPTSTDDVAIEFIQMRLERERLKKLNK